VVAGACDDAGRCVAGVCGNGVVEPNEQCDGGECCASDCRLKGPTEPCGTESRACRAQPLCTGREAACPVVDRPSDEGSTCSDGNACTVEDTCQRGECVPGPAICSATATIHRDGKPKVSVRVVCESNQRGECDARVVASVPGPGATLVSERIMESRRGPQKMKRIQTPGGAGFRARLALRLNDFGERLLRGEDVEGTVDVEVIRPDGDFHLQAAVVRLRKILKGKK
jgi:hypothetical protein